MLAQSRGGVTTAEVEGELFDVDAAGRLGLPAMSRNFRFETGRPRSKGRKELPAHLVSKDASKPESRIDMF